MYRISIRCENGHEQHVTFIPEVGMDSLFWAEQFASMVDGTNDMFTSPPREDPNSRIGKCSICGAKIDARVEPAERVGLDNNG